MRLSTATLGNVAADVTRFGYERAAQAVGIVHFGIGAFHRAHQAWYTDLAMDRGDRDWAIIGVSLRSAQVADQMNPQDGLYSVIEHSAQGSHARIVGAVRDVIVAAQDPESVIALLAAPSTRIISFTVTEKGYCRAADQSLDADLAGEGSIYRFLAEGLARRRAAGLPGLTLMSCDNLADNGRQLQRLLGQYLVARDASLAEWTMRTCAFPATMIDRIVPATTAEDRDAVSTLLGLRDEAAVMTEPFSQWVIEDEFAGERPCWEQVGAQLVPDVAPYETAKLRMLNGAHSALAYLGLMHGHAYVHEAIADPALRPLIDQLMRVEAATSFTPAAGQDLGTYADDLIARFANPALQHRLIQIAMDGSQKIPQRWLETLAAQQRQGRQCPAILSAIGGWIRHIRGDNLRRAGDIIDDPMAGGLQQAWDQSGLAGIVDRLFGADGIVSSLWQPTDQDRADIAAQLTG